MKHGFESKGEWKWHFGGDEAGKVPVDPASDHDHGQDIGQVALEHIGHHGRIGHGIGLGRVSRELIPENALVLVVQVMSSHEKRLLGQEFGIFSEHPRANQELTVHDLIESHRFGGCEQHRDVMSNDAHEKRDEYDRQEHPNPDGRVQAQLRFAHGPTKEVRGRKGMQKSLSRISSYEIGRAHV